MKYTKLAIPLFFFIIVGYFGFTLINNANNDGYLKAMSGDMPECFGIGYYSDIDLTIPLNYTEYISNDTFTGYFVIYNGEEQGHQYYMMALVDYMVKPIYYDGVRDTLHSVNLSQRSYHAGQFKVENITPGYHDIVLLALKDPNNQSLDDFTRIDTGVSHMGSIRFNVIRGNDMKPNMEFKNDSKINDTTQLNGLIISREPFSNKAWLSENVTGDQTLEYSVSIGNTREENVSYAVMQFLDYKQIPIQYDQSDSVYYGYLNKSEEGSVPISLKVPDRPGVHELFILVATNPYKNIEAAPGLRNNLSIITESSIRVGLNVTI